MICQHCRDTVKEGNYCQSCGLHDVKMHYPHFVPEHFVQVANDWHDGQTSALYSIGSTKYIYNKEYRSLAEAELNNCSGEEVVDNFISWLASLPPD